MDELTAAAGENKTPFSEPPMTQKRRGNGKRPFLILFALTAALLLAFGIYALATHNQVSTDDAQIEAEVSPISTRVAGTVVGLPVQDNQKVKAGDLLVEIDSADYEVKVRQAEAQVDAAAAQSQAADAQEQVAEASSRGGLRAARASLSSTAESVQGADADIDAARAALAKTEAEEERYTSEFQRDTNLLGDKSISQAEFDRSKAAYESARAATQAAGAQLAAARNRKASMESRVGEARGHVEQSEPVDARIAEASAMADLARAKLKDAEAALEQARLQLSYTKITAPFDGTLSRLAVHNGQYVQAAQMVVELVPSASYIVANFKETQIGRMRPGQRATVEIDAFPGRRFKARVGSLSAATGARFSLLPPDNASGNFVKVVQRVPVKLVWSGQIADPPQVGLSVTVTVHLK